MIKKRIVFILITLLICSLSATNLLAQGGGKFKKSSPFLITGKLPHLTKLLMQQWDNPDLHLQEEQKSKLLLIRKETIGGAQRLGKEIGALENQVAEGSHAGKTPEELQSLVQQIAELKSEATMVQLHCIFKTSKILDQKQLALIKQ